LPTPQKKAHQNYVINRAVSTHKTFNFDAAGRALTPASVDVKRGENFAIAKFMTLFTVNWKHWLDFGNNSLIFKFIH
jgi:hypothetical protein